MRFFIFLIDHGLSSELQTDDDDLTWSLFVISSWDSGVGVCLINTERCLLSVDTDESNFSTQRLKSGGSRSPVSGGDDIDSEVRLETETER